MIEAPATAVARAYLEEISLAGFCDPDYDPDENDATGCRQECVASASGKGCGGARCGAEGGRAGFDDICDYLGLDDDGARDRRDLALPALAAYRLRVGVVEEGV
jgi:MSHA pilin protein MshD